MTYDDWGRADTEPRMDLNYAGLEQLNDYGGYVYDEVLDLYYVRNRFYDPADRRWTSPDPHWGPDNLVYGDNGTADQADGIAAIQVTLHIRTAVEITIADPLREAAANAILPPNPPDPAALAQSANLYAYVLDNPLRYIDRDGEIIFMFVTGAVGLVVGGIAGGIYSYVENGEVHWQDVVGGAAIGGAIGLTGGAAVAIITTGSAAASTTLVGIGAAKIAGGAATAGTAVATRVIGSIPEYKAKALDIGAKFFDIPITIWDRMSSVER
jgi:RHS repeat-associated protein